MSEETRESGEPLIGRPDGEAIHVMSYNLRHATDAPPRDWARRRALVSQLIGTERPTVVGTQEAFYGQLRDLEADLTAYRCIWLSREGGSSDESMAVFYDTSRLDPVEFQHRWLSDDPLAMGSRSWGNEVPRMLTWIRFGDLVTGREFVFLNTHFDHWSAESRKRSAELVRDTVADLDAPTVVTGDFNEGASSDPHKTLTATHLVDTWDTAATRLTPQYATFNNWDAAPFAGDRIDWILTTPDITTTTIGINTRAYRGQVPSDHWPVQALLTVG